MPFNSNQNVQVPKSAVVFKSANKFIFSFVPPYENYIIMGG